MNVWEFFLTLPLGTATSWHRSNIPWKYLSFSLYGFLLSNLFFSQHLENLLAKISGFKVLQETRQMNSPTLGRGSKKKKKTGSHSGSSCWDGCQETRLQDEISFRHFNFNAGHWFKHISLATSFHKNESSGFGETFTLNMSNVGILFTHQNCFFFFFFMQKHIFSRQFDGKQQNKCPLFMGETAHTH